MGWARPMTLVPFRYELLHSDGSVEDGFIVAENVGSAREVLTAQGHLIIGVRPSERGWGKARVSRREVVPGLRALGSLLAAGLPMNQAIAGLRDMVPRSWHSALVQIELELAKGVPLSAALERSSAGIPVSALGVIRSSEAAGDLSAGLSRAAQVLEYSEQVRTGIRSSLAYPLVLAVASGASVTLLVTFVLPRFAAILQESGQPLPLSAQLLLGFSGAVRIGFLPIVLLVVTLAYVLKRAHSKREGRRVIHAALSRLPWLGALRVQIVTADVLSNLAAVLSSGAPLGRAVTIAREACFDEYIAEGLLRAEMKIAEGIRLSDSLAGVLTPTACRLIRAGEESGQLTEMLNYSVAVERREVELQVQRSVRVIEPVLIVLFSGVVAWIAAALLQAVYSIGVI